MLDIALKRLTVKIRITVKSAVSFLCVVLAVALPQIAHIAGGTSAGATWLPIYLPILIAGCLLGWTWGLGVGIISPLVSFGFTTLVLGNAMPALARLPVMIIELVLCGLITGLFAKKIQKNSFFSYPAVITAQIAGRFAGFIMSLILGQSAAVAWNTIQAGLTGLYLQVVIVPFIVILLAKAVKNDDAQ